MAQLVVIGDRAIDALFPALVPLGVGFDSCIESNPLSWLEAKLFEALGQIEPDVISRRPPVQVTNVKHEDCVLPSSFAAVTADGSGEAHPFAVDNFKILAHSAPYQANTNSMVAIRDEGEGRLIALFPAFNSVMSPRPSRRFPVQRSGPPLQNALGFQGAQGYGLAVFFRDDERVMLPEVGLVNVELLTYMNVHQG